MTRSDSNRSREIAEKMNVETYLIDGAEDIQKQWLQGKKEIGVTAGASAPEVLVEEVMAYLQKLGVGVVVENEGQKENVVFRLPRELK